MSFEFFTRDFPGKKMKWKKFLKGFLWKIEAGEKNLKGFPFKFTLVIFPQLVAVLVGDKARVRDRA